MILQATMLKKTKVKRWNMEYIGSKTSVLRVLSFNLGLLQHGGLQDHLQKHSRESGAHCEQQLLEDWKSLENFVKKQNLIAKAVE